MHYDGHLQDLNVVFMLIHISDNIATITVVGVQERGECSLVYSKARAAAVPGNSQLAEFLVKPY